MEKYAHLVFEFECLLFAGHGSETKEHTDEGKKNQNRPCYFWHRERPEQALLMEKVLKFECTNCYFSQEIAREPRITKTTVRKMDAVPNLHRAFLKERQNRPCSQTEVHSKLNGVTALVFSASSTLELIVFGGHSGNDPLSDVEVVPLKKGSTHRA